MSSIFTMKFIENRENEEFLSRTFYPSTIDGIIEYEVLNIPDIKSGTIDKMQGFHWARSAIMTADSVDVPFDDSDYKILAVSPPTAINLESFKERYSYDQIFANEHVEGTMVNVFYDPRNKHWEMATKHAVCGNYWYYRTDYGKLGGVPNQTFRSMFIEAFGSHHCSETGPKTVNEEIWLEECLPALNDFPKEYSYSFVLQHPNNHIVFSIKEPCVYLVAIYKIGETIQRLHPDSYESNSNEFQALYKLPIRFPQRFNASGYDDLEHQIYTRGFYMGIMLNHMESGERAVIRNNQYLFLKNIRGNHPNLQYHFFEMIKNGTLGTFQIYFHTPYYDAIFNKFWLDFYQFVEQVHKFYVQKFITKQLSDGIPKKYFVHIMRLHELYKVRHNKITLQVVMEYFMDMSPGQIMFYLDYDNRKQQKSEILEKDWVELDVKPEESVVV